MCWQISKQIDPVATVHYHYYCLDNINKFSSTLAEAKQLITIPSTTLYLTNVNPSFAILEVNCDEKSVINFCKLFKYEDECEWKEYIINDTDLTVDALKDVNEIYHLNENRALAM